MSYFIFDGVLETGKKFELSKNEAKHLLRSRRMKTHERFHIQDDRGKRFEAVLISFGRNVLTFVPEISVETPISSSLNLEILQAITKGKSIDWILQKSTELGVERLDFFCGKFSPYSFRVLKKKDPLIRWHRIVLEASKQCGRQFPPEIYLHENLKTALKKIDEIQNSWLISPGIKDSMSWKDLINKDNIEMNHRILVGPEGGFHSDEINLAIESGMIPVDLGQRIMRSETATVTAIAILQFLWGDLANTSN